MVMGCLVGWLADWLAGCVCNLYVCIERNAYLSHNVSMPFDKDHNNINDFIQFSHFVLVVAFSFLLFSSHFQRMRVCVNGNIQGYFIILVFISFFFFPPSPLLATHSIVRRFPSQKGVDDVSSVLLAIR